MFTPTQIQPAVPFNYAFRIEKSSESENGDWIVEGPLSSERKDLQGEVVLTKAVRNGIENWKNMGYEVDWNHLYDKTSNPQYLIGKGIDIYEGTCATGGTTPWAKTRLMKGKEFARKAWEHKQEGGDLYYSISGEATRDQGQVIDTKIHRVALTTTPVNLDACTSISSLAKSICNYDGSTFTEPELIKGIETPLFIETANRQVSSTLPADSPWNDYIRMRSPVYQMLKALQAGSGAGLDSTGGRAIVKEDLERTLHSKTCECVKCRKKRARRRMRAGV